MSFTSRSEWRAKADAQRPTPRRQLRHTQRGSEDLQQTRGVVASVVCTYFPNTVCDDVESGGKPDDVCRVITAELQAFSDVLSASSPYISCM